jgi:hypothetical protein
MKGRLASGARQLQHRLAKLRHRIAIVLRRETLVWKDNHELLEHLVVDGVQGWRVKRFR